MSGGFYAQGRVRNFAAYAAPGPRGEYEAKAASYSIVQADMEIY